MQSRRELRHRRRGHRAGFTLIAVIAVLVIAAALAAAVVAANSATLAEQSRVEQAQAFYNSVSVAGGPVASFTTAVGSPPGTLSQLSDPITTADRNLCGGAYNNGKVGAWSGPYVERVFPATGTPVGIGLVSDTLIYQEVSNQPQLVFFVRSVPEQEAMRLDARIDTLAGTPGSAAGDVRWTLADASGLVTLRWAMALSKKCKGANQSPTAAFTYVCTGVSCVFTNGSTDSDGTITTWSWNFGDGGTSTLQNPSHVYAAVGSYTVTLTVTDDDFADGSISQSVSASNIVLTGTNRKSGPNRFADLAWTGAIGANVDVYRGGVLVVTTANDGAYSDSVPKGTFVYQVCQQGTLVCSNTVTVNT
jgi:PKD repeat protein/type II secretory pathway pseudopilin PulG